MHNLCSNLPTVQPVDILKRNSFDITTNIKHDWFALMIQLIIIIIHNFPEFHIFHL